MSKNQVINDATGEILEAPKFRSMWFNPFGCIKEDCSSHFEESFVEIPPYAVDPNTGEFLNNSSVPKLVSKGKVDVYEKIQSFKKEVDLYSILEKFAYSGDQALLNAKPCSYGDISGIPDNINDYAAYVDMHMNRLKTLNPELAKMVIDESFSSEAVQAKADDILKGRVDSLNKKNESEENK